MDNLKVVGKPIVREDSYSRARGKTKYLCDTTRSNMLYGKLVLSIHPHAKVTINKEMAEQIEGIVAIYTFENIPKIKYNSDQWYRGLLTVEDEYLLTDTPLHVGDRIALVVGTSYQAVDEAINKLDIHYHLKAPVIGVTEAAKNLNLIKGDSNLAFSKHLSSGDILSSFTKADFIIEDIGSTVKLHHSAIEPHICLCEIDEFENLVLYTPCQAVFQCQQQIAKVLGLPIGKVRAIKANMGGSFGGKCQSILEPLCAFATYDLKRPVQLSLGRKGSILGARTRNSVEMKIATAVTKDGKILGRKIAAEIDGGAYYTNSDSIALAMAKKAFRLYQIDNQSFLGNTYYTNTPSGGSFRGYGGPQLHALTEINIDNVARKLNMDPTDFRLQNLVNPGALDPTGGPALGQAKIKECVLRGREAFNWQARKKELPKKNTERYRYGLGMACATHINGYKGAHQDFTNVEISILPDNYATIKIAVHEQGCGTISSLSQIAAEALDMPVDQIILMEADTFITPYDTAGTRASRVTFVCGGAIKKAATALKQNLTNYVSSIENCPLNQIETHNGRVSLKNTNHSYTYGEVALHMEKNAHRSLVEFIHYESPANPGCYAAAFTEVKVDCYTGHVEVLELLAVHDIGKAINPKSVEGQILGGAQMAIGMALREQILIEDDGSIKTKGFSNYHIINSREMPPVKVLLIEELEPFGPYGAKSVGELAASAPAPAILNAINNALGTNILTYPATPEVILKNLY